MNIKLILNMIFGTIIGTLAKLIEINFQRNNLTLITGLAVLALGLLLINSNSRMNFSLTLPDALWTGYLSKIKKNSDASGQISLIIIGVTVIFIGAYF